MPSGMPRETSWELLEVAFPQRCKTLSKIKPDVEVEKRPRMPKFGGGFHSYWDQKRPFAKERRNLKYFWHLP